MKLYLNHDPGFHQENMLFRVTGRGRKMWVHWDIPALLRLTGEKLPESGFLSPIGLAEYLYWSLKQGARYRVVKPIGTSKAVVELTSGEGCVGEYQDHLYWDGRNCLYRVLFGTHSLTQHGLDGFPEAVYMALYYDHAEVPIFFVEAPKGGCYVLSLRDWGVYCASGRNEPLKQMAVSYPGQEVDSDQLVMSLKEVEDAAR